MLGAMLRRLRVFSMIVTVHAHPNQFSTLKREVFYMMTRVCSAYVAEDQDVVRLLQKKKVPATRIHYIPIGSEKIDEQKKVDSDVRAEFGIPPDRKILLNIGRMVRPKGQEDILRAVKYLNEPFSGEVYHGIIVGFGPEEARLKRLASELGVADYVTFAGKRVDLHNFYAVADWFIMPCYDESMGVVIYEALGYRIPVIAYRSGSIAEVIDSPDMGILINRGWRSLVRALSGANSRVRHEALLKKDLSFYSINRMIVQYRTLYKNLLEGSDVT